MPENSRGLSDRNGTHQARLLASGKWQASATTAKMHESARRLFDLNQAEKQFSLKFWQNIDELQEDATESGARTASPTSGIGAVRALCLGRGLGAPRRRRPRAGSAH